MNDRIRQLRFGDSKLPTKWVIGDAELEVEPDELTAGRYDAVQRRLVGAAGRAWLRIACARPHLIRPPRHPFDDLTIGGLHPIDPLGRANPTDPATPVDRTDRLDRFRQTLEVVAEVSQPETEISLAEALTLQADAALGQSIAVELTADRAQLRDIAALGRGLGGWLDSDPVAARFLVAFDDLTVEFGHPDGLGHVIEGSVHYPIPKLPRGPIEIPLAGFTIVATELTVDLRGVHATATVQLPPGVTDAATCGPATLDLGTIRISPTCDYFVDASDAAYGPWLIGDTGVVVEGTGYVLDLSTTQGSGAAGRPASWRGLELGTGSASGASTVPDPCNTGYLRGTFRVDDGIVIASGYQGRGHLDARVAFTALNPFGQTFAFDGGYLQFSGSAIVIGQFTDGATGLVTTAVCDRTAGAQVQVKLPAVAVQPDLDLTSGVDHRGAMAWGELTHVGDEQVVWFTEPTIGFLFLPAGAVAGYSPVRSGAFVRPNVYPGAPGAFAELKTLDVSGVTFCTLGDTAVFSPDVAAGANPIKLDRVFGWLRVGAVGVDGSLGRYSRGGIGAELGDPADVGYAGVTPFKASLFDVGQEKVNLLGEFVESAAWDSHFSGHVDLPDPTQLSQLEFSEMKLTSTASIVGGDIALPPGGVPLAFWDVTLVPMGPPNAAGVLSVRTGRVLFTSAGIAEPRHFARPFGLTWGEVLANGALGELYLDFVDWGQRFDGLVFHPEELTLSRYVPGDLEPYLGVAGSVCFPFFGMHHVNIRDAAKVPGPGAPGPYDRHVTVPKTAITPHSAPTDLALTGIWHDVNAAELAHLDLPDLTVDYNEASQEGFLGTGGGLFSFLHSDPLDVQVEIHSDATDIRFTSVQAHGLDIGALARLGALAQIAGNIRIEGTTIRRMTVYGTFEQSAAVGVFGPKAGLEVEANFTVTPTTLDFYASGDMMLMLGPVELEASATAHLLFDFAAGTAEGELQGRVDADASVAGLSGEGQLTWFMGPSMQYLQGRLQVKVFTLVGGASLEGGFFIGNNVPNALAWALDTSDPRFKMSRAIMPAQITGIYGYGRASFGFDAFLFGGGVDIFVGAGAFVHPLLGGPPVLAAVGALPYIAGACGIGVHGEILGGIVSASAWANLSLVGPVPLYFEGTFGLRGCVLWVLCASVSVTARYSPNGFELF